MSWSLASLLSNIITLNNNVIIAINDDDVDNDDFIQIQYSEKIQFKINLFKQLQRQTPETQTDPDFDFLSIVINPI